MQDFTLLNIKTWLDTLSDKGVTEAQLSGNHVVVKFDKIDPTATVKLLTWSALGQENISCPHLSMFYSTGKSVDDNIIRGINASESIELIKDAKGIHFIQTVKATDLESTLDLTQVFIDWLIDVRMALRLI